MKKRPLTVTGALRAFFLLAADREIRNQTLTLVKGAVEWWAGKKIAVIGPTASGKDSFLARLQNREIPKVHSKSPMGEKVKSFRVHLALSQYEVIDVTCKGVINIGGEADYRDAPSGWISVCREADVIFYMMTIQDLLKKDFLKGRRIREDLDWILSALPHFKRDVLIHILINKIDEQIENHTGYQTLVEQLAKELYVFETTVKHLLHPYEARWSGATLISMKNKQIYTLAIHRAFHSVYSVFHKTDRFEKSA